MPEYLLGFTFHEPEPFALWQKGVIEDFESSTGLWVEAESSAAAIAWGEQVAEALHRHVNADPSGDWKGSGHSCWHEASPAMCPWKHCLLFFQKVRAGEMPPLDRMGTAAYSNWLEQNGT